VRRRSPPVCLTCSPGARWQRKGLRRARQRTRTSLLRTWHGSLSQCASGTNAGPRRQIRWTS